MAHRYSTHPKARIKNRDLSERVIGLLRFVRETGFDTRHDLRGRYGDDALRAAEEKGFLSLPRGRTRTCSS